MIKQYGELFFCIFSDSENIVYNRITDPKSGRSCYPDILILHGFSEAGIEDFELYRTALEMQQKYGTSRCFFISAKDSETVDRLAAQVSSAYASVKSPPTADFLPDADRLCGLLRLSETMRISFLQLIRYYALTADAGAYIASVKKRFRLPVSTKSEGKKIYEIIRNEILR